MVKKYFSQLFTDIFLVSLLLYTSILFLELMKKGSVASYLNTAHVVAIIAVSGALSIVLYQAPPVSASRWPTRAISTLVGLYIGLLIFNETASLGMWAYVFALGGVLTTASCGMLAEKERV